MDLSVPPIDPGTAGRAVGPDGGAWRELAARLDAEHGTPAAASRATASSAVAPGRRRPRW